MPRQKNPLFWLCPILLFIVLSRAIFFNAIIFPDEGVYDYIGWNLIEGKTLYADLVDYKMPGIHYLYSLSFVLFGKEVTSPRILATLFSMGTAYILYRIGRRLYSAEVGIYSSAIYAMLQAAPSLEGMMPNVEIFVIFFYSLSIYYFLKRGEKARYLMISGFLAGLAILIKQPAVLVLPGYALCIGYEAFAGQKKMRRGAWQIAILALFAAAPLLLAGAYLWSKGVLADAIYYTVVLALKYAANVRLFGGSITPYLLNLSQLFLVWAFIAIGILTACRLRREQDLFLIITTSALLPILKYTYPLIFPIGHYALLMAPTLSIFGGVGVFAARAKLNEYSNSDRRKFLFLAAGILILMSAAYAFAVINYNKSGSASTFITYESQKKFAQEIQKRTSGTEHIQILASYDAYIYFLSGRGPPTKYIHTLVDEQNAVPAIAEQMQEGKIKLLILFEKDKSGYSSLDTILTKRYHLAFEYTSPPNFWGRSQTVYVYEPVQQAQRY